MKQNVLVIGGGAREHALVWKLKQSHNVNRIYSASGNAGIADIATIISKENASIERLIAFAKDNIDLTVVVQDKLLALGIVDAFQAAGLRIFGPTKAAAKIEASKVWAKERMFEMDIPTAYWRAFTDFNEALWYCEEHILPVFIKANGLCDGRGAYKCTTKSEAEHALREIMRHRIHGDAGDIVIIEEALEGPEISIHAFCDSKTALLFPSAQDHKTLFDDDEGPMTGGMGAYAPVPWVDKALLVSIKKNIVERVLLGLEKHNTPFTGCLYPGLKITPQGPRVLEFNARLGDPEAQVYMRLLKTDLFKIFNACIDGKLQNLPIEWHKGYAVCVVLASRGYGYPDKFETGFPIKGIELAEKIPGVVVFHAGTAQDGNTLVTAGGRVLGVSAIGETLETALARAYQAAKLIQFEGIHFRHDIGAKAFKV